MYKSLKILPLAESGEIWYNGPKGGVILKKPLDLMLTFMKIGLFTFGGGYAMLSVIEDNCVEKKQWISHEDMMNITVIAESTPGPIAINCATFVGYKQAGILGALAATFGVISPSFVIIYAISMFLDHFLEYTIVANAFRGIQLAVGVLIIGAAIKMFKSVKKTPLSVTIAACACVAMLAIDIFSLNFSSIALLVIAGVVGVVAYKLKGGEPK